MNTLATGTAASRAADAAAAAAAVAATTALLPLGLLLLQSMPATGADSLLQCLPQTRSVAVANYCAG